MIIYVLDDGETYTLTKPTPVWVSTEHLTRIEGGEKLYQVVPHWQERTYPPCNCVKCTKERMEPNDYALCVHCGASHHMDDDHQCSECGGMGHTIGFEGPKKIKYQCERCNYNGEE